MHYLCAIPCITMVVATVDVTTRGVRLALALFVPLANVN